MGKSGLIIALLVLLIAISFHSFIFEFLLVTIDVSQNPRVIADSKDGPAFPLTKKGQELHSSFKFISDLHTDTLLWPNRNLTVSDRGFVSMERLRKGNIAIQGFFSVSSSPLFISMVKNSNVSVVDPISILSFLSTYESMKLIDRNLLHARKLHTLTTIDKKFQILKTKEDLNLFSFYRKNFFVRSRQGEEAPIAGILGIEGLHSLEGDISNVDKLYDAGYRIFGLSHFFDSQVAGSATGEEKFGLTSFGFEVLRKMEKLHIIPDLAHTSENTIDDVVRFSNLSPLVSHTGVKAVCNNSRNIGDKQIIDIASRGGLIGIGFWVDAVCGNKLEDVIKSIRHVADLVGVKHVCLGSDWDGSISAIVSSEQVSQITEALLLERLPSEKSPNARRFSDSEIEDILGRNFKNFLEFNLPSQLQ